MLFTVLLFVWASDNFGSRLSGFFSGLSWMINRLRGLQCKGGSMKSKFIEIFDSCFRQALDSPFSYESYIQKLEQISSKQIKLNCGRHWTWLFSLRKLLALRHCLLKASISISLVFVQELLLNDRRNEFIRGLIWLKYQYRYISHLLCWF